MNDGTVLFYSSTPRMFRTTLIGYLRQLCRARRVVLLSEELDADASAALARRDLFPGLEAIVPVAQHPAVRQLSVREHGRLARLAFGTVARFRPAAVTASSDMDSVFELYLMRAAREAGAATLTMQGTLTFEMQRTRRWIELTACSAPPCRALGRPCVLLARARKALGHAAVYYALPLLCGRRPFRGPSSHIRNTGHSGMRDSMLHTALTGAQKRFYEASGTPAERLAVVPHPLAAGEAPFFREIFGGEGRTGGRRRVLFLYPWERAGFRAGDLSPIPGREYRDARRSAVAAAARVLAGWEILVKPHPMVADLSGVREDCGPCEVLPPDVAADRWAEACDAVVELPRAASTASFFMALRRPGLPVLALDFHREFLGDMHRDSPGVEYIDDPGRYERALAEIRDGAYRAPARPPERPDFTDMADALGKLLEFSGRTTR